MSSASLHTSGQEGDPARQARAWGAWVGKETGVTVAYHDERYSTVDAEERLIAAGIKRQGRKEPPRHARAQILLAAAAQPSVASMTQPIGPLLMLIRGSGP